MKKLVPLFAALFLAVSPVFSQGEIFNHIESGQLVVYFPSFQQLMGVVNSLFKRFYGANYSQMVEQYGLQSKNAYGVNIFKESELKAIGVNTAGPLAYIHVNDQRGYIILTVDSKDKFQKYMTQTLGGNVPYKFVDNYAILSENLAAPVANRTNITSNAAFKVAAAKLSFDWSKPFVWIESSYLSSAAGAQSVTRNIQIPYGFTAVTLDFQPSSIRARAYSGLMTDAQRQFIHNIRVVEGWGSFDLLDYVEGTPVALSYVRLNIPMVYKYIRQVDQIGILGINQLVSDLWTKYRVNVERDLINNADGRFNLVIEKIDQPNKDYVIYGSIGVRDTTLAKAFVESLKTSMVSSGNPLNAFDIFTIPFYHYESTNLSFYYGLVERDFIFCTDKDTLVKLVKSIFDEHRGSIAQMPGYFQNAITNRSVGYNFSIDVQSFLSQVRLSGFDMRSEFLIGIKNIYIYGAPDSGADSYGWDTTVEVNFYQ